MNLFLVYPDRDQTQVSVNEFDKSMLIDELYEYWEGGYNISDITTELPDSICMLGMFDGWLEVLLQGEGLTVNQATEEHVREVLERCIQDDWDVLNELINQYGEECAAAHLEFAGDTGSSLDYAIEGYEGEYDNDREFTDQLAEACFSNEVLNCGYFDWESFCSDAMLDYTEINGYYFRNH